MTADFCIEPLQNDLDILGIDNGARILGLNNQREKSERIEEEGKVVIQDCQNERFCNNFWFLYPIPSSNMALT